MKKGAVACGIVALSFVVSTAAHAAEANGFYAGAGFGQSKTKIDGIAFDEGATAYKVFGGYMFNANFGLEAEYLNGGSPSKSFVGSTIGVSSNGFNAAALWRIPLPQSFAVYAKIGYAFYHWSVTSTPGFVVPSTNQRDRDLSYGAGVTYTFRQKFEARFEYEGVDVPGGSFGAYMLGGAYKF